MRAGHRAVGDDHSADALLREMACSQFNGFTGTDQQRGLLGESAKIWRARVTAAKATDTGLSPMAVSVRTCFAVLKKHAGTGGSAPCR